MLLEFCEEDIHDAFSLFKDRFIIRKLIREHKSPTKPIETHNQHMSRATSSKKQTCINLTKATKVSTGSTVHSYSPGQVLNSCADVSQRHSVVPIAYQPDYSQQQSYPSQVRKESLKLSTGPRVTVKLENVSRNGYSCTGEGPTHSTQSEAQGFPPPVRSPLMHHVVSSSVEDTVSKHDSGMGPQREAALNSSQNQIVRSLNIITMEEKQRIKKYAAEALLEKKCIRSKPNEAQHLGSLAIRNAAQSAQIWDNPPVLKEIPLAKKEQFIKSLIAFAPQLSERMDTVWIRLREALQNRRKYLSDKETGKRQNKAKRVPPYAGSGRGDQVSPALLTAKEPGPFIDLTDAK